MKINNIYRTLANLASPGGEKGKLQIYIFHRVLDSVDPFSMGEPDVRRFDALMRSLSEVFNILPLPEAIERLGKHDLPKRAACITFDDGYYDNYTNAYPVLKKYNVPATIFIATDYMNRGIMWNDIVIESIRMFSGDLSIPAIGILDSECKNDGQRLSLINRIIPAIKHLPQEERAELAQQIEITTGYQRGKLMMNEEEIIELHNNNITIGAHTMSHPILANLTAAESEQEIAISKERLEGLLGEKVDYFAYPNGKPQHDYTQKDVDIVKKLGFKAAVSTRISIASGMDNLYELPRFTPWDANLNKFILRSCYETFKAI